MRRGFRDCVAAGNGSGGRDQLGIYVGLLAEN